MFLEPKKLSDFFSKFGKKIIEIPQVRMLCLHTNLIYVVLARIVFCYSILKTIRKVNGSDISGDKLRVSK